MRISDWSSDVCSSDLAAPGATDAEKAHAFAEHPIGSGPFMFESWERGSSMRIVRNPHYWKMGEDGKPLPYLDAVDFEIISDDAKRSEERLVGKECVSTCRSRWSPMH